MQRSFTCCSNLNKMTTPKLDALLDDNEQLRLLFKYTLSCDTLDKLAELDNFLLNIDVTKLSEFILIGLARGTSSRNKHLPSWNIYVNKVYNHLLLSYEERSVKVKLRGLINL